MKQELSELITKRTNLVIEYINQIINDISDATAYMNFSTEKTNGQRMCTLHIRVPVSNFERRFSLEIPSNYNIDLYERILNALLDNYASLDNISVTKFRIIHYSIDGMFQGVCVLNDKNAVIKMNLSGNDPRYDEVIEKYNQRCDELLNSSNQKIRR